MNKVTKLPYYKITEQDLIDIREILVIEDNEQKEINNMYKVLFNGQEVEIEDLGDVHELDYPDFPDAYIEAAYYTASGESLDDSELDQLTDENRDSINEIAIDQLY